MTEFHKPPAEEERVLRIPTLLTILGHTALYGYSQLIDKFSPSPPPLFQTIEEAPINSPQPLQPTVATITNSIRQILEEHSVSKPEPMSFSHKVAQSPRLIQFTDRIGGSEQAFLHYDDIKTVKDRFVTLAEQQDRPLSFDQQLNTALELKEGDVIDALTILWISSRQYARWLDNAAIQDLPKMSDEEILTEMKEWRTSILACKNADEKNFQDTAGDTYYAWTHVLSRVIYGSGSSIADRIGKFVFGHGTAINSRVRIFKQSLPSDHRIAADYGNHIGDAILNVIKMQ